MRPQCSLLQDTESDNRRLMSDYEVNLVNDNMQELYVRFYGPTESECDLDLYM